MLNVKSVRYSSLAASCFLLLASFIWQRELFHLVNEANTFEYDQEHPFRKLAYYPGTLCATVGFFAFVHLAFSKLSRTAAFARSTVYNYVLHLEILMACSWIVDWEDFFNGLSPWVQVLFAFVLSGGCVFLSSNSYSRILFAPFIAPECRWLFRNQNTGFGDLVPFNLDLGEDNISHRIESEEDNPIEVSCTDPFSSCKEKDDSIEAAFGIHNLDVRTATSMEIFYNSNPYGTY
eukprot:gene27243-33546_t